MFNHYLYLFKNKTYTKVISESFWSICTHIVMGALSLLILWFLTSYFSKEEFGIYIYLTFIVGFFGVFALSGADKELILDIANKKDGSYMYLFFKKFLFSLLGSVIFFILAFIWYLKDSFEVSFYLLLFGIIFPFVNTFSLYHSFYTGKRAFFILFKLASVREILFLIVVLFTISFKTSFLFFFVLSVLVFLFFDAISFFRSLKFVESKKIEKNSLKNSLSFTGINTIPKILNFVDEIIMGTFLGMTALASYRVALLFPGEIKNLSGVISSVLISRFVSNFSKINLIKILFFSFIINVLLVVFLIFIVGFLIKMIFPSYIDIIYLSQIAFISGIFIFPSTVLNTFLDAKRKFVDLTKVVLSVSILKFLGFLILIPWFGLLGAIIVIILDDIIQFIILFYLVFKNNFKN